MATLFHALLTCLTGAEPDTSPTPISDEKQTLLTPHEPRTAEQVGSQVVQAILSAEKGGPSLTRTLNNIVGESGWTERVASWVLVKLERALNDTAKLQGPLKEAFDRACEAALAVNGFVQEHPVFCTVVALGVLVIIAPWVIEALGFAELGPVEGSFAAAWQARYAGYVPKGSLFSFFQRLGMIWHLTLST